MSLGILGLILIVLLVLLISLALLYSPLKNVSSLDVTETKKAVSLQCRIRAIGSFLLITTILTTGLFLIIGYYFLIIQLIHRG